MAFRQFEPPKVGAPLHFATNFDDLLRFYARWRKSGYVLTYTGSVEKDETEYPFLEADLMLLDSEFSTLLEAARKLASGAGNSDTGAIYQDLY